MDTLQFIKPELLILVPVLNMVGTLIKYSYINDCYIPLILTVLGILFSLMYMNIQKEDVHILKFLFEGSIQGILIASLAVYNHQIVKQRKKQ